MIIVPPILRFRRRRREPETTVPGLTITSVVYIPLTSELVVSFSGPIVWNGIDLPSEFKAFTEDGYFDSPTGVLGSGPDWIHLDFNSGAHPGAAWELNGAMAGITPDIAFPQTGVVT